MTLARRLHSGARMTKLLSLAITAGLAHTALATPFGGDVAPSAFLDTSKIAQGMNTGDDHRSVNNVAYRPGTGDPNVHKLLVFFPGTPATPDQYTEFMLEAVAQGYSVIGLDYVNDASANGLCTCHNGCINALGQQLVLGTNNNFFDNMFGATGQAPDQVSYNSVDTRLSLLLDYLRVNDTAGAWQDYCNLTNVAPPLSPPDYRCTSPNWSTMLVAGHSQGGFVASWILKNTSAQKGLLFSSPNPYKNTASSAQLDTTWNSNASYTGVCDATDDEAVFSMYDGSYPAGRTRAFTSYYDDRYDGINWVDHVGHDSTANLEAIGLHETQISPCTGTIPAVSTWTKWVTAMDARNHTKLTGSDGHDSTVSNGNGGGWCYAYPGVSSNDFRKQVWDAMLNQ